VSQRWEPDAPVGIARERACLLRRVREYFDRSGALEVDTPTLSRAAVSDPNIESVGAILSLDPSARYYLHTSPEFAMKRMLAAGYPDIFQVCKVYRDGEAGRWHQPEFTMIEWYRLHDDFDRIVDDAVALVAAAIGRPALLENVRRIDYRDAFIEFAGCDPLRATAEELAAVIGADDDLRKRLGVAREDWLDLVLDREVLPKLPWDRLTVLARYPASQAALARRCPEDTALADRFEIFFGSHELANGYVELTDAEEQRVRIERDQLLRESLGRAIRPVDNALLAAMESGLPPCAGVAAGLDRLLAMATGSSDIRQVTSFAFRREHQGN